MTSLLDWMWLSELARNFALTAASVVGTFVAVRGLSAWRLEKEWDRDSQLATRLVLALERYRMSLLNLRFRRSRPHDVWTIEIANKRQLDESPGERSEHDFRELSREFRELSQVAIDRLVELEAVLLEVGVNWSAPQTNTLKALRNIHNRLLLSVENYLVLEDPTSSDLEIEHARDRFSEDDGFLLEPNKGKDSLLSAIDEVIEEMREIARRKLKVK